MQFAEMGESRVFRPLSQATGSLMPAARQFPPTSTRNVAKTSKYYYIFYSSSPSTWLFCVFGFLFTSISPILLFSQQFPPLFFLSPRFALKCASTHLVSFTPDRSLKAAQAVIQSSKL